METKTAAELIEEARLDAERSIKWTAEKSGIALTTFKRKLNGGTDFTVSETLRVARALGVEPFTLLPTGFLPQRAAEVLAA
ncbi:XRE family transcriptional regulator [Leucobacter muris]|uniref:XRE family transcriptional regulator n=1 Tax=Leucobacter muris TaxID=1935379 RepID=A0ABX5QD40_9MICO|nr:XRE family transcriptional regulator [Leucobacter muris]QAB16984.1 XRE family transcriptional regulator [Leucobacter muris]